MAMCFVVSPNESDTQRDLPILRIYAARPTKMRCHQIYAFSIKDTSDYYKNA